jgi:hypothetical protein
MNFLYPSFLWSILLIGIPIIIHLFNFRVYKLVYFSNLRFLTDIKDVSESKSKIKNIIILILRILTISALVIAFSGPYKPLSAKKISTGNRIVCIYLDNSYSMNAGSTYGNLFDASKERIRKIVGSYNNSQKFLFITNDLETKHRVITNKEQTNAFVNECKISPSVRNISEIIDYVKNFIKQDVQLANFQTIFYLISDFQKITADIDKNGIDSNSVFYLMPMATNKINNIYIDSCWFASAGRILNQPEELIVRIENKGDENYSDIPIKLFVNEKQKAVSSFSIEANQSIEVPIKFADTESGILPCYIEISDYPITYDNKLYFNYEINKQTSILVINNKSENKYIQALFKNDSSFIVDQVLLGNIKMSEFAKYHVIMLNELEDISTGLIEELNRFVLQGGELVLLPSTNTQFADINKLLSIMGGVQFASYENQETEIGKIEFQHLIYRNVFVKTDEKLKLPYLKSYFTINSHSSVVYNILLSSISGKPLLLQNNFGKGMVYTFCFPLSVSNSDFVLHQLFVPTFYNIAAYYKGTDNLYYIIGKDNIIDFNLKQIGENQTIHLVNSSSDVDFIPYLSGAGERGIRLDLMNNILLADNYFLRSSDTLLKCISFNFNRKESDTKYLSKSEISDLIKKNNLLNYRILTANLDELAIEMDDIQKERKDLWKIFILLAFIFITGEILVIRLWKDNLRILHHSDLPKI